MKHQTEIIWSGATPRTPSSQAGGSNYIKFQRLDEPAPVLPFNILQPPSLSTPPVMPCHVLQPGSSCFTLTRRICQLMASDKSSEAPVHTFRRCKHTCAREPLAKHLHRALQPSQQSGITQKPAASVQTYPNCPYICCLNVVFPSHSKHWKWNNCISRWQFTSNLTIHQVKITLWESNAAIGKSWEIPIQWRLFHQKIIHTLIYNLNGWFSSAEVSNRIWFPFQPPFSAGVWHPAPQRHPLGPSNLARFASGTWAMCRLNHLICLMRRLHVHMFMPCNVYGIMTFSYGIIWNLYLYTSIIIYPFSTPGMDHLWKLAVPLE